MKKFTDNFTNNFTKKFMKKFMKKSMQKMHNPRSVWGGRRGEGALSHRRRPRQDFAGKNQYFCPKLSFYFFVIGIAPNHLFLEWSYRQNSSFLKVLSQTDFRFELSVKLYFVFVFITFFIFFCFFKARNTSVNFATFGTDLQVLPIYFLKHYSKNFLVQCVF